MITFTQMSKTLILSVLMLLLLSCQKQETINLGDGKPHGEINILQWGPEGKPFSYNVYCIDDPDFFNERDTTAEPTFRISGIYQGQPIKIQMHRNDFYYIIAFRDTVSRIDSFWTWNTQGGGWTIQERSVRFLKFNRTQNYGVTLPTTIY